MRLKSGIFVDSRAEKCACVSVCASKEAEWCGSISGEFQWTKEKERSGHSADERETESEIADLYGLHQLNEYNPDIRKYMENRTATVGRATLGAEVSLN